MDKNKTEKESFGDLFVPTYHVELLFDKIPEIFSEGLLNELQLACGYTRIEADTPDFLVFAFEDHAIEQKDKKDRPHCVIVKKDKIINYDTIQASMAQTWDWPEKESIIRQCNHKIVFSDFLASDLDNITRLKLFNQSLLAVLKSVHCTAIHWVNSQKLVSPEILTSALNAVDVQDYLYGALNVRLFAMNEETGEFLMDTLGMSAFGIPDLQCNFKGLNPEDVAGVLINYGYYIFEKGDVIADGHTIQGITEDQKWHCNHQNSIIAPNRRVLNLDPGGKYSGSKNES
jgi:Domain of unknown function (DUF4261)